MPAKQKKLPPPIVKAVLDDIETTGLRRENVRLKDIVDANIDLFMPFKAEMAVWWQNVKRRSIFSYAGLLDEHQVRHGRGTIFCLDEAKRVGAIEEGKENNGNDSNGNDSNKNPGGKLATEGDRGNKNDTSTDDADTEQFLKELED